MMDGMPNNFAGQAQPMRKYLSVSSVSLLGMCEMKFLDAVQGRQITTQAMKAGTAAHEKLAAPLPKLSKAEIIAHIVGGKPISVREVPVFDPKLKLAGRIDQLSMTGRMENGRNTGVIIDDKYPANPNKVFGLTLYYKLQLSTYSVAVANSYDYGKICSIVGAKLTYREKGTDRVIQDCEMDLGTLRACESHVDQAVGHAWSLYRAEKLPRHRRFDVATGEWTGCYCEQNWRAASE